jgi:hypothetical protein
MRKIQIRTKKGTVVYIPEMKEKEFARESEEYTGFCLGCGEDCSGIEPDARKYECDSCGEKKVYGLEELMIMGLVRLI